MAAAERVWWRRDLRGGGSASQGRERGLAAAVRGWRWRELGASEGGRECRSVRVGREEVGGGEINFGDKLALGERSQLRGEKREIRVLQLTVGSNKKNVRETGLQNVR